MAATIDTMASWYDSPPRRDTGPGGRRFGWVYFIEASGLGLVKIGWSMDPEGRLRALLTHSPVDMRILTARPGGVKSESALHRHFKALCVRGEWFRHEGELAAFVESVLRDHGPAPWASKVKAREP